MKYLVYGLLDPRDGELRYIGKSSRGLARPRDHRVETSRKGPSHRATWLRELFQSTGQVPCFVVLKTCISHEESFTQEVNCIAMFTACGYKLTNETIGGRGSHGYKHTPETINKMRLRVVSEETRAKLSAALQYTSDETRLKMSIARQTRVTLPETRIKMSLAHKGKSMSPEMRAKMSIMAKNRTPEHRANLIKSRKEHTAKLKLLTIETTETKETTQ